MEVLLVNDALDAGMSARSKAVQLPARGKRSFQQGLDDDSPDVRDVVKLSNDVVQQLWSGEPVIRLDLRAKVSKDNHRGHLRPDQDGPDQQLKVRHPLVVVRVGRVKFENDEVGRIGEVVCGAIGVICRVGLAERSVGELVGWVGEDGVPPVEQFVGVAFVPDGVVACAETRRDCEVSAVLCGVFS